MTFRSDVKSLCQPSFWTGLAPQLTISSEPDFAVPHCFTPGELWDVSQHFQDQGYLYLPTVIEPAEIASVSQALVALEAAGLPPVFIYVFDQPWEIFHRLSNLIGYFLGDQFALLPNFWAWHVAPVPGQGGWPPHQDCQAETRFTDADGEETLMSLSLWVPLVDVSEQNCCMYVLPRSVQEKYAPPISEPEQINLTDGVALPANAGSVMGWPQDLYHWSGKMPEGASVPRMSLSLEFQNPAFSPLAEPLLDVASPPPFEERLALIAAQFEKYRHMESCDFNVKGLPLL